MLKNILDIGYCTSKGIIRQINEDSLWVDKNNGVFLVADGMGGHFKGDVASKSAIEMVKRATMQNIDLVTAIRSGHIYVKELSKRGIGSSSMGTTIVAVKIESDHIFQVSWVGDSRLYLWNDGILKQISTDHTYVQELLDSKIISYEETLKHPKRHLLTSAIGASNDNELIVDTLRGNIKNNDVLLLCTDGLTNEVDDKEISNIIAIGKNNQDRAKMLVDKANQNGGRDNITVILVSLIKQKQKTTQFNDNLVDSNAVTMPHKAISIFN